MRELVRGNFGYSISNFPSLVSDLLLPALPWTIGLLTFTTLISWALGSILGAVAGWRGRSSTLSRVLVPIAFFLYTTPYYILALMLLFFCLYLVHLGFDEVSDPRLQTEG